jgi:anti-sigma factor RsiW
MNCTEVRQDLEALLDKALDDTRRQSIELHLTSCHTCRGGLAHLQSLERALRENYTVNVPASLDQRVFSSFNARHARGETGSSRWRKLFLGSFRIPAPVFGLFLLTAIGAVAVSYWVGKQNATSIIVSAPPPPAEVNNPIVRGPSIDHQASRPKTDERQTSIATRRKTAALPSKHIPLSAQTRAGTQQLRSSTTINANSATYSTVASLKGFEPLTSATARIIKGDHDK